MNEGCDNGELDPNQPQTLSILFGFYCDGLYKMTILTTCFFMAGIGFGVFFSQLADIYGRKPVMIIIAVIDIFGVLLFFFETYLSFLFGYTIIGAGSYAIGIISMTYITEWGDPHFRNYTGVCVNLFWAFCEIFYTFFAHVNRGWKSQIF